MALLGSRTTARRRMTLPRAQSSRTAAVITLPAQRRGTTLPVETSPEPPPAEASSPRRKRSVVPSLLAVDAAAAAIGSALWASLGIDVVGFGAGLLATIVALVWLVSLALARSYTPRLSRSGRDSARQVLTAALGLLCAVALAGLLLDVSPSREGVLSGLAILAGLTLVTRGLVGSTGRRGMRHRRSRITVVGENDDVVRRFVEDLRTAKDSAVDVVAVCLVGTASGEWCDVPVLRDLDAVDGAVERLGTDAVMVLPSHELGADRIRRLAWRLEKYGTHLFVVPTLPEVSVRRVALSQVGRTVAVQVHHAELGGARKLAKEAFDRVVAAAALTAVLPLLALLMLAVRLDTPGPSLFRQERVGKDGRRFTMLKLRTMSMDAEDRRAELLDRNDCDGVLFKIHCDPRITRTGALLRRYSLDELPQLVNVLYGHMSLVGPRPPLPSEVAAYEDPAHRRLAVKPGITGLWQVSGRSNLTWAESVCLDLRYVENWSLGLDAAILWRTGRAVLAQEGAY